MTEHKPRRFGGWIVGTLVAAPLVYVLSFGPVCWWLSEEVSAEISKAPRIYWPLGYVAYRHPEGWAFQGLAWYATYLGRPAVLLQFAPGRSDTANAMLLQREYSGLIIY